jgi:hypothetical protein
VRNGGTNLGSLADLQRAFQDYLLGRDEGFRTAVRDSRRTDRDTLLAVYRDGYGLRLLEVLGIDYPGLRAAVGVEAFEAMARAYIAATPSRHRSVRWYGGGMADFLTATAPFDEDPAAAEMARFEWTLGLAFDGRDATPIAADALVALPPRAWETLTFDPLPTLQRLTLAYDVPQAWQQREAVEPGTLAIARAAAPVAWAVWRPDAETQYRSLEADEAMMLEALSEGRSFPDLCAVVAPFVGEAEAAARGAMLLRTWVEGGMIAGFRA